MSINAEFARDLRAGTLIYNATAALPHPMAIETMARAGYRSITLDVQHGYFDHASILAGIAAAASAGATVMVRTGFDQLGEAARYLDAGAAGVIVPMIDTAEDARRLVAATRYPPVGQRSWGPGRATAMAGLKGNAFLHGANDASLVFAMIETARAVENVDAILATQGLDGLFVGPLDLSVSLSDGGSTNPDNAATREAMGKVAEAARRHGKIMGTYAPTDTLARQYIDQGYRFLAIALDIGLIAEGAARILDRMPQANNMT